MRESRTYGSVRGALSNERPYRDRFARNDGRKYPIGLSLFDLFAQHFKLQPFVFGWPQVPSARWPARPRPVSNFLRSFL